MCTWWLFFFYGDYVYEHQDAGCSSRPSTNANDTTTTTTTATNTTTNDSDVQVECVCRVSNNHTSQLENGTNNRANALEIPATFLICWSINYVVHSTPPLDCSHCHIMYYDVYRSRRFDTSIQRDLSSTTTSTTATAALPRPQPRQSPPSHPPPSGWEPCAVMPGGFWLASRLFRTAPRHPMCTSYFIDGFMAVDLCRGDRTEIANPATSLLSDYARTTFRPRSGIKMQNQAWAFFFCFVSLIWWFIAKKLLDVEIKFKFGGSFQLPVEARIVCLFGWRCLRLYVSSSQNYRYSIARARTEWTFY